MVRIVLAINAVGFLIVGMMGLASPSQLFAPVGLTLDQAAMIEWRGVYGGINLAAGMLISGALKCDRLVRPALYVILCLTGGYVGGRIVSLAIDGIPDMIWLSFLMLEAVFAGLAILCLRRVGW